MGGAITPMRVGDTRTLQSGVDRSERPERLHPLPAFGMCLTDPRYQFIMWVSVQYCTLKLAGYLPGERHGQPVRAGPRQFPRYR